MTKTKTGFKCEFCGKVLTTEKYFANHLCESKRRWLQRDDKPVKLAFWAWKEFMKLNRVGKDKNNTYEKFMKTNYYTGFVKFGYHIHRIHAIDPESFILFVLKNGVRIDDWCKDFVYENYLREWYKKQPPDKSFEQTYLLMLQWSREENKDWKEFFKEVNVNIAVQYIRAGRISPWVLYHSTRATELIERFNEEQMELIYSYIDPKFWKAKFALQKEDAMWVEKTCEEIGI